jgi:enterochelin esterase-like enzyme
MSLTGPVLAWLLWIAAIGLFGWITVSWPRSAGPGMGAVLRRMGYQLALIVTVVLAVAVSLNDDYGWYANWADLGSIFAADAPGNVISAGDAAQQAAADVPGRQTETLTTLPPQSTLGLIDKPGPLGQLRTYAVPGVVSGVSSTITVWFPTQYTDPAFSKHRFPVIEAFHGVPGTPKQLWDNMALGTRISQQTAQGHLAPSVVVMPAYAPHQVDTECVNGNAGQPQMETWITRDVTSWVEHHLRVQNARSSWAAFGFSAGAWCASMLAMLHPDLYSAAISLGGYYQPSFESAYFPFRSGSPQWDRYNMLKLVHDAPPKLALWVQTSKADPVSWATTQQLLADARAPMSVTADVQLNVGHRISVWLPLVATAMRWLGATAPGFEPTAHQITVEKAQVMARAAQRTPH